MSWPGIAPPAEHRFNPGVSGNPSGLPKNFRRPTDALRQLNETTGETPEAIIEAFKAARGKKLCGADFKAIAMFLAESDVERRTHVAAFEAVTDHLEGKVPQAVNVKSEATLTIQVIDRDVQLAMLRASRRPLHTGLETLVNAGSARESFAPIGCPTPGCTRPTGFGVYAKVLRPVRERRPSSRV